MISFTTRNRPHVLDYSLRKTREHYDGFIVVIDDNSEGDFNAEICKKWDCAYLFNEKRRGIPRSKERGFRALLTFDRQIWLDDDCFIKEGFIERITEAMEHQGHLLHLKKWAHIAEKKVYEGGEFRELPGDLVAYTGATACMMTFRKDQYEKVEGFHLGWELYGGWHHNLSLRLAELDEYVAVRDSSKYVHSFDIDGVPQDFDGMFQSSLPQHERVKK